MQNNFVLKWMEDNADIIAGVRKLLPETRGLWLDDFLMSTLADVNWRDDNIPFLFDLCRALQVELGLRSEDFSQVHQNLTRPLVTELSDTSEEVLPGSFSNSARHLKFKLDVYHEIERTVALRLNDQGHPNETGYGHDTSRLLSLTGMLPRNIGVRPLDNRSQRIDHGLENDLPSDLIQMADDFLLLLFGLVQAKSIRIEGKSQSGLPCRQFGKGYKTVSFVHAVHDLHNMVRHSNDLRYLLEEYDILHAFLQGSRRSPDAGGKKRYVTSASDNASGLAGKTLQDNKVRISGVSDAICKHFATMRYRFVWGGNSTANSIVNVVGTSARACYGAVYEFTFKHRGKEHLMDKLRRFSRVNGHRSVTTSDCDMFVLDVSNFDLDYPKALLERYLNLFINSPLGSFFARTAFSPSVQGTRDKGDKSKDPIINGDPLDFDFKRYLNSGLPSGWSFVSDAGKMMALAIYYSLVKGGLLNDHSIEQLDQFLKGKLDYAVWNLGDDNVVLGPAGSFSSIQQCLEKHCCWKTEPEPGARFIGFPICVDDFGQYSIRHDPASYVTNMLTPERGIRSAFRKYWAIGLQQREVVYADSALINTLKSIINRCWKKHYGSNLDSVIASHAEKQALLLEEASGEDALIKHLVQLAPLSPKPDLAQQILADILRDHSVLSWKYENEDIVEAFGIEKSLLESRPKVWTSEKVLSQFGYNQMEATVVSLDDYNGQLFILADILNNRPELVDLLLKNFKEANICL